MTVFRSLSIAKQLRYSVIFATLISVFITATLLILISFQFQYDRITTLQQEVTQSTAQEVSNYVRNVQSKLGFLSRIPGFAELDKNTLQNILEGLLRYNSAFENVAILDSDEEIIVSLSAYQNEFPAYLDLFKAFDHAYGRGEEFIGLIQYDEFSQITYSLFAVPIRDNEDEIKGVLLAQVNLVYLDFVTSQTTVGNSGYLYVVDQSLSVIAGKDKNRDSAPTTSIENNAKLVDAIRQYSAEHTLFNYTNPQGAQVMVSVNNIEGLRWHVVSELPVAEIYAPIVSMLLMMFLGVIISVIIAIGVSVLLSKQVITPLEYLTKLAEQISAGNRDVVVKIKQENEFGILANTLNTMVAQLNSTISKLEIDIEHRKRIETALRESEEKYRQLVDLAQEGIWVLDTDSLTTFVNPSMAKMFGYTKEEMMGKSIYAFMDDAGIAIAKENLERRKQGLLEQHDFTFLHKDGRNIYVAMETAAIIDENDVFVGAIAGVIDISSRRLAEERQFKLQLEKERTNILTNFVTQASHEFRTPLSSISTSLYLLSKSHDQKSAERHINKIENRIRDITSLVDALVTLTQLETIENLDLVTVNVQQILSRVMTSKRTASQDKQLHYSHHATHCDINIFAEEDYLQQAFEYFIDNAIRFTPEGGTVSVDCAIVGDDAVITITDTGIGIGSQDLPHIFERFFRTDKDGTTRGMGLGLPIAARIIELHQGAIDIETEVGKGTRFNIFLPLNLEYLSTKATIEQL